MSFDLEKFFADVFAPQPEDVLTIMYDLPHGEIQDKPAWQDRRDMALEWQNQDSFIFPDGTRKTAIKDGELVIESGV